MFVSVSVLLAPLLVLCKLLMMSFKNLSFYHDRHLVVLGTVVAEVPLLVRVAVLTAVLMVIGLETAQQVTGRTNVTAVVKEDTLRETARTVLVLRRPGTCTLNYCFL